MDLRVRSKLHPRLNDNEWITNGKSKRKLLATEENQNRKRTRSSGIEIVTLKKTDVFCWKCHKPECDEVCETCSRTFHAKCLQGTCCFTESKSCPECLLSSEASKMSVPSGSSLKEIFTVAIDRVFDIEGLPECFLEYKREKAKKPVCVMDKKTIIQRINAGSYKNPQELYADLKWIIHNAYSLSEEKHISFAVQIQKKFEDENLLMDACLECYYFKNVDNRSSISEEKHFSQRCTQPHKVIFAKVRGHPFWPGKCLKILKNNSAVVVFFGTFEMKIIFPQNYVTLESPSSLSPQKQWYVKGLLELEEYYKTNLSTSKDIKNEDPSVKKLKNVKTQIEVKTLTKGTQTNSDTQAVEIQTSNSEIPSKKVSSVGECNPGHSWNKCQCVVKMRKNMYQLISDLIENSAEQSLQNSTADKATADSAAESEESSLDNDSDKKKSHLALLELANLILSISNSPSLQGTTCKKLRPDTECFPGTCLPAGGLFDHGTLNNDRENPLISPQNSVPLPSEVSSQTTSVPGENIGTPIKNFQTSVAPFVSLNAADGRHPVSTVLNSLPSTSSQTQQSNFPDETRGSDDDVVVMKEIITVQDSPSPSTSGLNIPDETITMFQKKINIIREDLIMPMMRALPPLLAEAVIKKETGTLAETAAETPSNTVPFANMYGSSLQRLIYDVATQNYSVEVKKERDDQSQN